MFNRPCANFNTTINCSSTSKSKKPRYINADESITKTLSANTLKVYMSLRFEVDFKKDVASVKKTAQEIADIAGIGRTRTFKAFNELENVGLLQRQETRDRRNTFWIAKELGYFTKVVQTAYHEQPNSSVQDVNGTVHNVNTYQYSLQEFNNRWGIEYDLEKESTQFDLINLKQNRNEINETYYVYNEYRAEENTTTPTKSDYCDNQT